MPRRKQGDRSTAKRVRALSRGLALLEFLNTRNPATVAEAARAIRMARTTTFRMLETLVDDGFLQRLDPDGSYRLTSRVRGLADGFGEDSWIAEVARPHIAALGRRLLWPVAIVTLDGGAVLVRETTDHDSPLVFQRATAGFRVPILASAAGRLLLAHAGDAGRDALLPMAIADIASPHGDGYWRRLLEDVRKAGYAVISRPDAREGSLAVGVEGPDGEIRAAITVRWFESALSRAAAIERLAPELRMTADAIRDLLASSRPTGDASDTRSERAGQLADAR